MFQPLKGLRIVDLTQVLAGPYATYQLALLGADVIKIETVTGGDWTRPDPNRADFDGMSIAYMTQASNKRSVCIDLKKPEGLRVLHQLIETADVFVENFRPGTAARLGLSFDDVKAVKDNIIYCSMSAYGQDGPIGKRPAYDHVVQGMCGIMTTTGTPETVPNKVGAPYVDYATGQNAAFAMLAAIMQAKIDGKAHHVDVSMLDSAMLLMASLITETATHGTDHGAYGNEAWSRSPSSGAFETTSGTLMIAANNERQFRSLCEALGRKDVLEDPRWAEPRDRRANSDALRHEFETTIALNSADHWEARLAEFDVPGSRVRTVKETVNEAQFAARELLHDVAVPGIDQSVSLPTLGFKADHASIGPTSPPPALGADTADVLREVGVSDDAIEALQRDGAIRCA